MIFGRRKISARFKPCITEMMTLTGAANLADYIPFLGAFDLQGYTRRWKDISKVMDEFIEKIIDEYEKDTKEKRKYFGGFINVIMSLMKNNNSEDEKFDRSHIKGFTLELLAAVIDTSATAIEWALSELFRHPEVLEKAQQEIEDIVGLHHTVEETDLEKLDYLNMIVKESMRLHPVAGVFVRQATENFSVNGFHIANKTWIITNNWAMGRGPDVWPEKTEEFYPERFINSNIDVRGHDMQLLPFGSGRRKCPGIELGLRTVHLVVAQLLHCFSWKLPAGMSHKELDMKEKFGMTITRANPILVVPEYRLHTDDL